MPQTEKKGYVVMLGVLGFKEFIARRKDFDFFENWSSIKTKLLDVKSKYESMFNDYDIKAKADVLCLSDTLMFCLSFEEENKLPASALITILPGILDMFLYDQFKERVFFRGAISFGTYMCDMANNIAMGEAINEAADWHESTDWMGVILTPSAKYALEQLLLDTNLINNEVETQINNRFREYPIPFKSAVSFNTRAFIWFKVTEDPETNSKTLAEILKIFSECLITQEIASKYENTIEFVADTLSVDIKEIRKHLVLRKFLL